MQKIFLNRYICLFANSAMFKHAWHICYFYMIVKAAQVHDVIKLHVCVVCGSVQNSHCVHCLCILYEFVYLNGSCMHICTYAWEWLCARMLNHIISMTNDWLKLYLKWGTLSVLMICLASFNRAKFPPLSHFTRMNSCYCDLVDRKNGLYALIRQKCWCSGFTLAYILAYVH